MSTARVSSPTGNVPSQVLTELKVILERDVEADRIALLVHEVPELAPVMQKIAGHEVKLVCCTSELALRETLVRHEGPEKLVILLCFKESPRLGKDVLARLWENEVRQISPWRTLQQLTEVQSIDPRVTRQGRWLPRALLECHEAYREQIRFGEVLDLETAWLALARGYLGYTESTLELPELLRWSLHPDAALRMAELPVEVREHLGDWFRATIPQAATIMEALFRHNDAQHLLGVGLACSVMYAEGLEHLGTVEPSAIHAGRGRFIERHLGGVSVESRALKHFGEVAHDTCQTILREGGAQPLGGAFSQAEQILASLGFGAAIGQSTLLPGSMHLRLTALAEVLERGVGKQKAETAVAAAESALRHVLEHSLSGQLQRQQQVERAEMAVRLLRWLRLHAVEQEAKGLEAYVSDGSFVDWARSRLWAGEDHEVLSQAYQRLAAAVTRRREAQQQAWTEQLMKVARGDHLPEQLLPVEQALDRVVTPMLAAKKPTLLLVLDGMSLAVYRELQSDLLDHGWIEVVTTCEAPESCLVATLPTTTEYSRCSLLSGALTQGLAAREQEAFRSHAGLRQHSSTRFPPVLLHKQDLQQPGSGSLASNARGLIASTEHRIVAAVINAIDDQLSSSSQIDPKCNLEDIPVLRQILGAAREAGRAVIITSDHGHVLDHDTVFAPIEEETTNGERYRQGGKATEREVLLKGARVLTPDNEVILPVTEQLRYVRGRNRGYHGGGSLQEVAIPLGVYISTSDTIGVPNRIEVPRRLPVWWQGDEALASGEASVQESAATMERQPEPAPPATVGDLFAPLEAEVQPTRASADHDWIEALLRSAVFKQNQERAGRVQVSDDQLRQLLRLLSSGHGAAMTGAIAQKLAIPRIRLRGFLAAVQKLLNVDGYPVLKVDREAETVKLDQDALRTQFEL